MERFNEEPASTIFLLWIFSRIWRKPECHFSNNFEKCAVYMSKCLSFHWDFLYFKRKCENHKHFAVLTQIYNFRSQQKLRDKDLSKISPMGTPLSDFFRCNPNWSKFGVFDTIPIDIDWYFESPCLAKK